MDNKRSQRGSRVGFILAATGSAVGLGNIWKFPGRAYEGGGGSFLLIYLLIVIFLGAPLMITELSVGRASQSNIVSTFQRLGHKGYSWVGWVGVCGAFVSLAKMFESMPGGRFFGVLFYLLLLFAALTSCISLIESIVAFLTEKFSLQRKTATVWLCLILFAIGCLYTCSQAAVPLHEIWLDGTNGVTYPAFCDFMEYLTDRIMIPVCALGCCIFVGWVWKPEKAIEEVESCGAAFKLAGIYKILIKYVAPVAILTILIMSFTSGMTLS